MSILILSVAFLYRRANAPFVTPPFQHLFTTLSVNASRHTHFCSSSMAFSAAKNALPRHQKCHA